MDGHSRFRRFCWHSEGAVESPRVDSSVGGEGQGVARSEAEGLDVDVGLVEGNAAGQLSVAGGGLSEPSVFAEANCIDSVVLGEETQVVLAS